MIQLKNGLLQIVIYCLPHNWLNRPTVTRYSILHYISMSPVLYILMLLRSLLTKLCWPHEVHEFCITKDITNFSVEITISKRLSDNTSANSSYGQTLRPSCKLQYNVVQRLISNHIRHTAGRHSGCTFLDFLFYELLTLDVILYFTALCHICVWNCFQRYFWDVYLLHCTKNI